jgi:PAS domain S-box-containing protein
MVSRQIRMLVAGTADAAFADDASGLISAWNATAEELFGLSSTEAIGLMVNTFTEQAPFVIGFT